MSQPADTGLTCDCCGQTDGVEHEAVTGVRVDPTSMLCLYCQPCPDCGRMGTTCWDNEDIGCTTLTRAQKHAINAHVGLPIY